MSDEEYPGEEWDFCDVEGCTEPCAFGTIYCKKHDNGH